MFAFAAQDLAHDLGVPFVIHSCTSRRRPVRLTLMDTAWDTILEANMIYKHRFFARFDNYVIFTFTNDLLLGTDLCWNCID